MNEFEEKFKRHQRRKFKRLTDEEAKALTETSKTPAIKITPSITRITTDNNIEQLKMEHITNVRAEEKLRPKKVTKETGMLSEKGRKQFDELLKKHGGEDDDDDGEKTIQEQTLNSLVIMVYNLMSGLTPRRYSTMYKMVRTLSLRLREYKDVMRMDELYQLVRVNERYGMPLATAEYVFTRDSLLGLTPFTRYDSGRCTLMEIIEALNKVEIEFLEIFTRISIKHNIDVNVQQIERPQIEGGGMPDL